MKYLFLAITSLIAIIVLSAILLLPKLTPWVREKIEAEMRERCPNCEFRVEEIALSLEGARAYRVLLKTDKTKSQYVEMAVHTLTLKPNWNSLLQAEPKLEGVIVYQPEVRFFDVGDNSAAKSTPTLDLPMIPDTDLIDGVFIYVRDVKGTHAELTVRKIEGRIYFEGERFFVRSSGQVGESGKFSLLVDLVPKQTPLEVNVDMKAENQNLIDLSAFFEPNAGVYLEGTLLNGHAVTKMKGNHLDTNLNMKFKDFNLKVNPMYDRNEIQTFFTNLGAKLFLMEKNLDNTYDQRTMNVQADRDPTESVVSFILRSWKEAALKIVQ